MFCVAPGATRLHVGLWYPPPQAAEAPLRDTASPTFRSPRYSAAGKSADVLSSRRRRRTVSRTHPRSTGLQGVFYGQAEVGLMPRSCPQRCRHANPQVEEAPAREPGPSTHTLSGMSTGGSVHNDGPPTRDLPGYAVAVSRARLDAGRLRRGGHPGDGPPREVSGGGRHRRASPCCPKHARRLPADIGPFTNSLRRVCCRAAERWGESFPADLSSAYRPPGRYLVQSPQAHAERRLELRRRIRVPYSCS
jgi:hypothetical protein